MKSTGAPASLAAMSWRGSPGTRGATAGARRRQCRTSRRWTGGTGSSPRRPSAGRGQSASRLAVALAGHTALRKKSIPAPAQSRWPADLSPGPLPPLAVVRRLAAVERDHELVEAADASSFCGTRKPLVTIAARIPRRRTSTISASMSSRRSGSPPRNSTRTVPSRANSARSARCSAVVSCGSSRFGELQ